MRMVPREPPNLLHELQKRALAIAVSCRGMGEDPELGNNRGADIDHFRMHDGVPEARLHQARVGGSGAWCAVFVSYCWASAALELGIELPHENRRGAKRLALNVGVAGRYLAKAGRWPLRTVKWQPYSLGRPSVPPGAVIAWDASKWRIRGPGDRWKGHVGIVYSYNKNTDSMVVIEGNHNNRRYWGGSKGYGRRYAVVDSFAYPNGEWRKRLAVIASYI